MSSSEDWTIPLFLIPIHNKGMAQFSRKQKIMLNDQLKELERFSYGKVKGLTTSGNEILIDVEVCCTTGKKYLLRLYISPDFPNSYLSMVVVAPDGILKRKDHSLLGFASRQDHVLSSKSGYTRISYSNSWVGNKTLLQVIEKGLIWLEAYEIHLQEGGSIDRFLQVLATVLHAEVPLQL